MNFQNLNTDVWNSLNSSGTATTGYKGIWLGADDSAETPLHIFKDEFGNFHFAIEVNSDTNPNKVIDPKVNGLNISLSGYLLDAKIRRNFIDIRCNIKNYLPEFTKVTRDICTEILINGKSALSAVNDTVKKWKVFWDKEKSRILSEEEQIGLLCELTLLSTLCSIAPEKAINSWVGPFDERHDFVLDKFTVEVKGTRSGSRKHTINGIDQLLPFPGKDLLFVSFIVSKSEEQNAVSLPTAIDLIYEIFHARPDLTIKFNELLSHSGYSPLNSESYEDFKFILSDEQCYWVNSSFPSLTRPNVSSPLIDRISSIRYDVTLDGMPGTAVDKMDWSHLLNL